jgi:hypothetical protein
MDAFRTESDWLASNFPESLTRRASFKCVILLASLLLLLPAFSFSSEEIMSWKKVKDRNGIQIYRAHTEESKFKTFKAVTRFELDNIQSFVGLLLDDSASTKWIHMLSGAEIVPTDNPYRNELYVETRLPWPVKDRFSKMDTVLSQDEDYTVRFKLHEPRVPAKKRDGYILAPISKGFYEVKPVPNSKEVEVIIEILVDPGGAVPAFLVNLITDDMSYFTTKKFRKIIQTEPYLSYTTDLIKRRPWVLEQEKNQE